MHSVYIMASRPDGAIYIGRTANLPARVAHHKAGLSCHTRRHAIDRLVWFEVHETFAASLARERSLKRWRRIWKNALIAERNPDWQDITSQIGV